MRLQFLIVSTAGLSIIACDPGVLVEGTVTDGADKAIPGARISVNCEGAHGTFSGNSRSDNDGRFTLPLGLGCLPDSCHVVISVDSSSKDFSVGEHCETSVAQCDNGCNLVQIDAQF
jgi:hypothetical protein